MEIRGCIFDLDGVIVDTAKYHYLAWKRLANSLSFDFSEVHNEQLKGVSRMRSLDIILQLGNVVLSDEEKLRLATEKNQWYLEYILQMDESEILPGVLDFLEELRRKDVRVALGSASKNAQTILDRIHLSSSFDVIVDGNMVEKAKPDPEVFYKGAELMRLEPHQCIVFEDAQAGVAAALNAGMYCVGIGEEDVLGNAHIVIPGFQGIHFSEIEDKLKEKGL